MRCAVPRSRYSPAAQPARRQNGFRLLIPASLRTSARTRACRRPSSGRCATPPCAPASRGSRPSAGPRRSPCSMCSPPGFDGTGQRAVAGPWHMPPTCIRLRRLPPHRWVGAQRSQQATFQQILDGTADQGGFDVLEATSQEEGPPQERRKPRQASPDLRTRRHIRGGSSHPGCAFRRRAPSRQTRSGRTPGSVRGVCARRFKAERLTSERFGAALVTLARGPDSWVWTEACRAGSRGRLSPAGHHPGTARAYRRSGTDCGGRMGSTGEYGAPCRRCRTPS